MFTGPLDSSKKRTSFFCHTPDQIPKGEHWAIIEGSAVFIPGDERSRKSPGHGYPERTDHYLTYQAFTDEAEFKTELKKRLESLYCAPVRGIHVDAQYIRSIQIEIEKT